MRSSISWQALSLHKNISEQVFVVACRISQVLFDLRTNCYQSCYVNLMCELLLFFWRTPIHTSILPGHQGYGHSGWTRTRVSVSINSIWNEAIFYDAFHKVCGLSQWQTVPSPLYLPEEEQEQESDGVLLLLYVCEVPPRVVELHRPRLYVHPREAKADKTDNHLLSVLQRRFRYFNTWLNLLVLEGEHCELIVGFRYTSVHGRRC